MVGPLALDTIGYAYDEYGRVKQWQINGAANSVSRVFDNLGRVETETNPLGTFAHVYAPNTGRLTEVSNGAGFRTVYEYYPSVPNPSGTGDGDLRLSAIKHYRATTTLDADQTYHYTKSGNISQWTQRYNNLSEGADYTLRYDAADELVGADRRDLASVLQREEAWSYDAAGNRELAQASVLTGGNYTVDLTRATHNNLNQMTSRTGGSGLMRFEGTVDEPATVTVNGVRARMRRDAGGTYRWSADANLASSGGNTSSNTIIATDARGNSRTKTAMVTTSGTAIPALSYDLAGNLLSDGSRTYEWDAANRLVRIAYVGQTTSTEFTYDGLGRRTRIVEKNNATVVSTQVFVWDGLTIAEERSGANVVTKRFYSQGEQQGVNNLFYRRDHLGSIRETTDAGGQVSVRVDYDLWGKRTVVSGGTNLQPTFGYTGHYYHASSGLHLAPYRIHSAELSRWLSRDPIEEVGGLNLYRVAANCPSRFTDPLGLEAGPLSNPSIAIIYLCATLRSLERSISDIDDLRRQGNYANLGQALTMLAARGSVEVGKNFIISGAVTGAGKTLPPEMQTIVHILETNTKFNVRNSNQPGAVMIGATTQAYADLWLDAEKERIDAAVSLLEQELERRGRNCCGKRLIPQSSP